MYMYYTLNEFTQFSRMIQKLKTDVWLWSFFQYYEQTALLRTTRKEEGLSKPTAWIDTELKDSYSPTSDYKFNTSTMFFSQSRVHVSSHNERKHQAFTRRTNRASKTSIFTRQTKWPFGAKDSRRSKKRLASAIVVRFSAGLTFEHSSSSL